MNLKSAFIGANGIRAGWRLLIFAAVLVACQIGIVAALRPLWPSLLALLRAIQKGPLTAQGLITMEIIYVTSVAVAVTLMSRIERRPIRQYGLPGKGAFGKRFWEGALWGLSMVAAMILLQRLEGVFTFGTLALHGTQIGKLGLLWAFGTLLVGIYEELTFRGYVQFTLASGIGFWPAAVASSVIFGVIHMADLFYDWPGVISAALFGLLFCLVLQRTGDLWLAVGFHAAVDFAETYLFASPTSSSGHLFNCTLHGSRWLTGGTVGPESSLNGWIVFVIVFWLFGKIHPSKPANTTPAG